MGTAGGIGGGIGVMPAAIESQRLSVPYSNRWRIVAAVAVVDAGIEA